MQFHSKMRESDGATLLSYDSETEEYMPQEEKLIQSSTELVEDTKFNGVL